MRLLIGEHYRTAKESLRRSRLRTLLTITGVAIGVASITTILALTAGITDIIRNQVAGLGDSIAVIRPATKEISFSDITSPSPQTAYTTSPIEERDLEDIKSLKTVEAAAPIMTISGSIRAGDNRPTTSTLVATTPDLQSLAGLEIDDGQFIDSVTLENTVVIGHQLAIDLFGTDQANGKSFLIRGQPFTVIGVLKRQNNPLNFNDIDFDRTAIIGLESGKLLNNSLAQIQQIDVKAKPGVSLPNLRKQLQTLLVKNHDGEKDTSVLIGDEIARPESRLFEFVSSAVSLIAGISLVVGGIGIMNIMLVSVSERTREIGLRKAVGASNSMVVMQFMMEALIISLLGGLLGYISGYVVAFFISLLLPYDPALHWTIFADALIISIVVGVLFGLYPAIRASRKDPIESLRRYH